MNVHIIVSRIVCACVREREAHYCNITSQLATQGGLIIINLLDSAAHATLINSFYSVKAILI